MSVESVRAFFLQKGRHDPVMEFDESSATVELAAKVLGVEPGMIAKTLALHLKERNILLVTRGDARIDNRKFKEYFSQKAKMLGYEVIEEITGHPVGGVSPFGLKEKLDIYLDISLQDYQYVYPAAGSRNSALQITPEDLRLLTGGIWITVC